MTTTLTAQQIAAEINNAGETYYGNAANGWGGNGVSRIYFGSDFVTIEASGEIHNRRADKARAQTIGYSAVELVEAAIARLSA